MLTSQVWHRLFLEERPSIGLSFFRLFAAFTTGAHVIPTLLHLEDNYLHMAFKEKNPSFFTWPVLQLVEKSPDGLVMLMTILFLVSVCLFAAGLFTQISCIAMVIGCYYFYALNSLHIGTLSFDILLVTLFLLCLTGYPGDYFSLDALRGGDVLAYKKRRPFFIQRLLQLQIASTFFYTALCKFTAGGNWIANNPIYYLLNSTPESVVKYFPLRSFFAAHPIVCHKIGLVIIGLELAMPILLFWQRTRVLAIAYGFAFHFMLLLTLHVPTIFFFLFPPQLLLFIPPEKIVGWIDGQRSKNESLSRSKIIYDGHCGFCVLSIRRLQVLDPTARVSPVDYQKVKDLSGLDPRLTPELCHSQIQLLTTDGKLHGGFFAFRRLSRTLPLLWPFVPILYFPGMQIAGSAVYSWVAKNRYWLHRASSCADNSCFR